jgi:hypothetical protein
MSLQLIEPTAATEAWVDLRVVAKHIGFGYQTTRRLAMSSKIPAKPTSSARKPTGAAGCPTSIMQSSEVTHNDCQVQTGTPQWPSL